MWLLIYGVFVETTNVAAFTGYSVSILPGNKINLVKHRKRISFKLTYYYKTGWIRESSFEAFKNRAYRIQNLNIQQIWSWLVTWQKIPIYSAYIHQLVGKDLSYLPPSFRPCVRSLQKKNKNWDATDTDFVTKFGILKAVCRRWKLKGRSTSIGRQCPGCSARTISSRQLQSSARRLPVKANLFTRCDCLLLSMQ